MDFKSALRGLEAAPARKTCAISWLDAVGYHSVQAVIATLASLVLIGAAMAADFKSVSPPGAQVVGPYTPGLIAGKFLYVSGQGAKDAEGKIPQRVASQVRQTLDAVKRIVEAAGLTLDHLVYAQMYLADADADEEALAAWNQYFKGEGPARAVVGVTRLPTETPVEINAVAITDLGLKRVIRLAGAGPGVGPPDAVIAGDRLYFSSCLGLGADGKPPADSEAQTQLALDRMGAVLKAAGIGFDHVVFVNPYLAGNVQASGMNRVYAKHFKFGDTPARATIHVAHLPQGAGVAFTGVAVMDLAARRSVRPKNMPPSPTASPCVFAGDTLYFSAKSAFIPGPNSGIYASSVENQVRQTMRNLLDGLEEAGMDFSNVVAATVYLDDVQEFAAMNRVYSQYFTAPFPTRTTLQPLKPVARQQNQKEQWPMLEQISLIAVK